MQFGLLAGIGVITQFNLSKTAKMLMEKHVKEHLRTEQFKLDSVEFSKHVPLQSVWLDNGAVMTAPTNSFDKVFKRQKVDGDAVRFTAEGRIIDQKLRRKTV